MRAWRTLALAALALASAACVAADTLKPFTTDGCSLFPDRAGQADWCSCCLAHDLAYWRGGTQAQRLAADRELRACVQRKTGNHLLAQSMYLGVRPGGTPHLATPFRWAYGWPRGRGYKPLDAEEQAQVQTQEAAYLAQNPSLQCVAPPAPAASDAASAPAEPR